MIFPLTPLNTLVEIEIDSVWTDITAYVMRDSIQIRRGQADEASQVETSACTLTLNNRDGRFSPRNPTSPYYGLIGRNTPIRVSLPDLALADEKRFTGEVSSWPQRWDKTGTDVYTQIECAGILRRLSQGDPISVPAYKNYLLSTNPQSYWPLDEGQTATQGKNASDFNASAFQIKIQANFTFGAGDLGDDLANGLKLVTTVTEVSAGITVDLPSSVTGYAFDWVWKSDTIGHFYWGLIDNIDSQYFVEFRPGSGDDIQISHRLADGTLIALGSTGVLAELSDGALHHVRFLLQESGSDVEWEVFVDGVSQATGSETSEAVRGFDRFGVFYVKLAGETAVALGHVAVYSIGGAGSDPPDLATLMNVLTNYAEETAGRRIERLCTEQGIPLVTSGDLDDTELMGAQSDEKSVLDNIRECAATDLGLLYEPRDSLGLAYRTRRTLFNQIAGVELVYSDSVFAEVPEPVDDDQLTRNDVIVTRTDGGEGGTARATLEAGPLSTQDPPDGVGRYATSVTVNVAGDAQLPGQAWWRMNLGTIDSARYPQIALNLARAVFSGDATLTGQAAALDVGDYLTITDLPDWLPPDDVALLTLGFTETLHNFGWDIAANCVPADLYLVPTYQAAAGDAGAQGLARFDGSGSTLNEALTTTETGVDVDAGDTLWTTAAAEFPFDIVIGGERMTVSTIGAAVGGVQTFTVTRSVNGIVKTHAIGDDVRLFHTPTWGF